MKLRLYSKEAMTRLESSGMTIWYYRRQAGKTTQFGWVALKVMAKYPSQLVTLVSASLNVGSELTEKEAKIFSDIIADMRREAKASGMRLETSVDNLRWDDYLDMLDRSKLEVKLYHSNSVYSRTKIIAPNVATARGYSGWVLLDEFGFIKDFKELYEAVEPIASSDPSFRIIMATTPPDDDGHYSYELLLPPDGTEFAKNPRGNWYESQAGILVHRVDAWDAHAAGVNLYDKKTRLPLTPEEHRAQALDRDAWDRNYGLALKAGGKSACSLISLQMAQNAGAMTCCCSEDGLPIDWRKFIVPGAPTVIAQDPATTEGQKSNPSGLVIAQRVGGRVRFPVICRYKTSDDRQQKAILREACDLPLGTKVSRIGIDASNERFYAAQVQRELRDIAPVELIVSSEVPRELESLTARERMNFKTYMGNLLVNMMDDGAVELPLSRWVKDDWRLVVRVRGGFDNIVDSSGNHGDTFDAAKIATYLLMKRGGPAEVMALSVGSPNGDSPVKNFMRPDRFGDSQEDRIRM
jgi:hypothetical protein